MVPWCCKKNTQTKNKLNLWKSVNYLRSQWKCCSICQAWYRFPAATSLLNRRGEAKSYARVCEREERGIVKREPRILHVSKAERIRGLLSGQCGRDSTVQVLIVRFGWTAVGPVWASRCPHGSRHESGYEVTPKYVRADWFGTRWTGLDIQVSA
jgi:hypothetical protein